MPRLGPRIAVVWTAAVGASGAFGLLQAGISLGVERRTVVTDLHPAERRVVGYVGDYRLEDAVARMEGARDIPSQGLARMLLGAVHSEAGHSEVARKWLDEARATLEGPLSPVGPERGRVYLTGVQALVRLPLDQQRRDAAAGLRTAGFISGYRGSPLGTYDLAIWQAREPLEAHHVRFEPGVNEDLAATAVWGSQQANLLEGPKYDGVFAIWYPVIERRWVERYERALRATGIAAISTYELCVANERREGGLVGSGMFVVNAPWQLDDELGAALPWLARRLGVEREAIHRIVV